MQKEALQPGMKSDNRPPHGVVVQWPCPELALLHSDRHDSLSLFCVILRIVLTAWIARFFSLRDYDHLLTMYEASRGALFCPKAQAPCGVCSLGVNVGDLGREVATCVGQDGLRDTQSILYDGTRVWNVFRPFLMICTSAVSSRVAGLSLVRPSRRRRPRAGTWNLNCCRFRLRFGFSRFASNLREW